MMNGTWFWNVLLTPVKYLFAKEVPDTARTTFGIFPCDFPHANIKAFLIIPCDDQFHIMRMLGDILE
jgi:hypothetical protein